MPVLATAITPHGRVEAVVCKDIEIIWLGIGVTRHQDPCPGQWQRPSSVHSVEERAPVHMSSCPYPLDLPAAMVSQPSLGFSCDILPSLLVAAGARLETSCPLFALRGLAAPLLNTLGLFWGPNHGWCSEGSGKLGPMRLPDLTGSSGTQSKQTCACYVCFQACGIKVWLEVSGLTEPKAGTGGQVDSSNPQHPWWEPPSHQPSLAPITHSSASSNVGHAQAPSAIDIARPQDPDSRFSPLLGFLLWQGESFLRSPIPLSQDPSWKTCGIG